ISNSKSRVNSMTIISLAVRVSRANPPKPTILGIFNVLALLLVLLKLTYSAEDNDYSYFLHPSKTVKEKGGEKAWLFCSLMC
ncbi:hypothetical protein L9F63_010132, partial [Diploptera punctata]